MNNLLIDNPKASAYFDMASAKSEAGFGDPKVSQVRKRQNITLSAFFVPNVLVMAVRAGRPSGLPVSCDTGSPTWFVLSPLFGDPGDSIFYNLSQDLADMCGQHPSCALIVPVEDIVTCVKASRTLVSITRYHLTRTTLPDGGEETLVAAIDKYSALAESLQALIDQHEEACNEL